ncbi:MAG: DUF1566 domain-containing protein [Gammaproteobacteria bacterium]|nr:DUF1566 domain-containing protein [Gammaproteobacteria bacterium]
MKWIKATAGIVLLVLATTSCYHVTPPPKTNDELSSNFSLNDTGVALFLEEINNGDGTYSYVTDSTSDTGLPGQDGKSGRDVEYAGNLDGSLGFNFSKLDSNGNALSDQQSDYASTPWYCVSDKVTGLTWEVKTYSGLQDTRFRYTWYNPDPTENGGNAGALGSGSTCELTLTECNTAAYLTAINALNGTGLCGKSDWRVPTREELRSLIHYGMPRGTPMIDTNFFPNTSTADYWSSQTSLIEADDGTYTGADAWEVHFQAGYSETHDKGSTQIALRLVRGPEK